MDLLLLRSTTTVGTSGSAGPNYPIPAERPPFRYRSPTPSRSGKPMRWRANAAAPRAPGASVGDSSSTVASPRAARTSGEAARSRAMRDRMGSSRAGPAAATPPPMTTRLTPSVRASETIARARWSATRSTISTATSSPAGAARKTSAAVEPARQDGACDRRRSPRRPGVRSPDRRRSSRGSRRRPHAQRLPRIGDDVAHLAGKAVVAAEQRPVENDAGRDPVPIARKATLAGAWASRRPAAGSARARPRGRRARRRPGPRAPSAAASPAAGG